MKDIAESVRKIKNDQKRNKLSEIAYNNIKNAIVNFKFEPGSCLSENMLAEALNMSRTPVREAVNILSQENLVEVNKGGIYVSDISINDLKQIYDARKALECEAIKSSKSNFTDSEIEYLKSKWKECLSTVKSNKKIDWGNISKNDQELHNMIVNKSKNHYIQFLFKAINAQVSRYQFLAAIVHDNIEDTIYQHIEIIDLIHNNNEMLIDKLGTHIDKAADNLIDLMIEKQGSLFNIIKEYCFNNRQNQIDY